MKRFVRIVTIALAIVLLLTGFAVGEGVETAAPGLEVYFLDLGRVDGILIRADGQTCFIDVGFKTDAALAIKFLHALGIERLNSYVGTHGHYDHIEGAAEMIDAFRPERIFVSHVGTLSAMAECSSEAQKQVIAAIPRVILQPGDSFQIGRGYLSCLGPLTIRQCFTGSSHENDNSLILRLDYGRRSMLFTGDTTDHVLRDINTQYPGSLNVDVLKNPHHNGAHDEDVIDMIQPKLVAFCTDDKNQPKQSYLKALNSRGIRALITGPANQGSVAVLSDGESLVVRCGNTAARTAALGSLPAMYAGQELPLTVSVEPEGALKPETQLGYNSSDESVAVAHNGQVRAVSPGVATITAQALNGVSASVEVHVYDAVVLMDETELKLAVGETRQLTGSVVPDTVEGLTGEWLSTDPDVVTVSQGKLTGVGEGTAQVIARLSNGAETVCAVTVHGLLARSVRLDRAKATMRVGDSLTLTAKVRPSEYDSEDLEWSSSDDDVLWVDDYGNVTAVGTGKAKITVVASAGVSDACTIRVK